MLSNGVEMSIVVDGWNGVEWLNAVDRLTGVEWWNCVKWCRMLECCLKVLISRKLSNGGMLSEGRMLPRSVE